MKVTMTVMALSTVFFISNSIYLLHAVILKSGHTSNFDHEQYSQLKLTETVAFFMTSVINPIIFIFRSSELKYSIIERAKCFIGGSKLNPFELKSLSNRSTIASYVSEEGRLSRLSNGVPSPAAGRMNSVHNPQA